MCLRPPISTRSKRLRRFSYRLPKREKNILYLRFYRDCTQMEVAQKIGISQVQVSRLERSALKKVKEMLS